MGLKTHFPFWIKGLAFSLLLAAAMAWPFNQAQAVFRGSKARQLVEQVEIAQVEGRLTLTLRGRFKKHYFDEITFRPAGPGQPAVLITRAEAAPELGERLHFDVAGRSWEVEVTGSVEEELVRVVVMGREGDQLKFLEDESGTEALVAELIPSTVKEEPPPAKTDEAAKAPEQASAGEEAAAGETAGEAVAGEPPQTPAPGNMAPNGLPVGVPPLAEEEAPPLEKPHRVRIVVLSSRAFQEQARKTAFLLGGLKKRQLEKKLGMAVDVVNTSVVTGREQPDPGVYYRPGFIKAAALVAKALPGEQEVKPMKEDSLKKTGFEMEIVLGPGQ